MVLLGLRAPPQQVATCHFCVCGGGRGRSSDNAKRGAWDEAAQAQTLSYTIAERETRGPKSDHTPLIVRMQVDTQVRGAEEIQPSAKNWAPRSRGDDWKQVRAGIVRLQDAGDISQVFAVVATLQAHERGC